MREEHTKRSQGNAASKGFSLLEIVIVMAVMLCLAGVAFPIFTKISYNVRLKSAAVNISGLMQQARIMAARQNAVYTVVIPSTGGQAFINLNPGTNSTWDSSEPVIMFNSNVT